MKNKNSVEAVKPPISKLADLKVIVDYWYLEIATREKEVADASLAYAKAVIEWANEKEKENK